MALFGKVLGGGGDEGGSPADYSPEKAQKFFEHARTAYETQNFEYAIQHYCNGMRQDPRIQAGLDGLWQAVNAFKQGPNGKKGLSKETIRAISGKTDADRFVTSLLEWMQAPTDAGAAVRAAELAGKAQAGPVGAVIADQAFKLALAEKKPRKDTFLRLSEAYSKLERHDKSVSAAEQALKIDPADGELSARIRSLAAAATMQKGGYEQAGQQGGFRGMIRDADKQRQLIEQESIVKTEETLDRIIADCEKDYLARPTDQYAIEKYAKRLLERGRPVDEQKAHDIYMKGHKDTQQVRFRIAAGEITIRQQQRRLVDLRKMLEAAPNDPDVRSVFEHTAREIVEREVEEYKVQVDAYPTDVKPKFELSKRYFALDRFEDAIALLQEIRNDPKFRGHVLNMLGQAFMRIDFLPESVETFRQATEVREISSDLQLEIRYNLMCALRKLGEQQGDLPSAEEAYKISSSIAIQQINYRDIRVQREAIGKLVQQLKAK